MLQIEKKAKLVSPTKRDLNTKMNYNTKLSNSNSQNCPHNKYFDRSLSKSNFSHKVIVQKVLFQANLVITVTV